MIYLGHVDLDALGFSDLMAKRLWPNNAYCWVRWQSKALLGCPDHSPLPIEQSLKGQIFWRDGEVKWMRLEDGYRVVYIGESPIAFGSLMASPIETKAETTDTTLVLHGGHVFDFAHIPRVSEDEVLCVMRREYSTVERGTFERFFDLAAVDERDFSRRR